MQVAYATNEKPLTDTDFLKQRNITSNSDEFVEKLLKRNQEKKQSLKLFHRKKSKEFKQHADAMISTFHHTQKDLKARGYEVGLLWYMEMWGYVQMETENMDLEELYTLIDNIVIFFPLEYQEILGRYACDESKTTCL